MLILDDSSDSLSIQLAASPAIAPIHWSASYVVTDALTFTPKDTSGILTDTSSAEMIAGPATGFTIQVKGITVVNQDTVPCTVFIRQSNVIVSSVTLQVGDNLYYSDDGKFFVLQSNGSIKSGIQGYSGYSGAPGLGSSYTVATLPSGTVGQREWVTNALTPVFGAPVVGGGAVVIPVFYNGTNWIIC